MTLAPDLDLDAESLPSEVGVTACGTASVAIDSAPGEFAVGEFFAGIGLARLGLETASVGFKVTWANDLDRDKQRMYAGHFGEAETHYLIEDIRTVAANIVKASVPTNLSLAWASFPCTDLSLAGGRQGLAGEHSGTFWDFTNVLERLGGQRPPVVAIENVNGFATSHGGKDIAAAIGCLNELGYSVDIMTLDARRWVPQSRPRLFLIAAFGSYIEDIKLDERSGTELRPSWLDGVLNDQSLTTHRALLPDNLLPELRKTGWTDIVDDDNAEGVEWWDELRTEKFRSELSPIQAKRVRLLEQQEARDSAIYRTAYRRTRDRKPAWEIRADDVAGCLRTARGGSSKQAVVRIALGEPLRVRWMTAHEYAALMGAPKYCLPQNRNQSIMGFGDAVCVDAVSWLAKHYLQPLLSRTLPAMQSTT